MPVLNTDDVPHAEHVVVGMCQDPRCGKLHIVLFDKNKKPLAVGAIDDPLAHIEEVKHWAYIAATRRDP